MKQGGAKKKKGNRGRFATVKIMRTTLNKLKANKEKNRTPIGGFIDMAVDEKLERENG